MKKPDDIGKLGQAWRERSGPSPDGRCPDPERIWEALDGTLAQPEVARIVEHTADCPACAEAWRLAREMGALKECESAELVPESRGSPTSWWRLRPVALVAGLVFLVGLGGAIFLTWPEPGDSRITYRATGSESTRTLVPEDQPLPRTGFKLAWTPAPSGVRYNVRITTGELEQVVLAEGLEKPEYLVPAGALEKLASGTRLLWQVEVVHPDGRRDLSPTFFATLQ